VNLVYMVGYIFMTALSPAEKVDYMEYIRQLGIEAYYNLLKELATR